MKEHWPEKTCMALPALMMLAAAAHATPNSDFEVEFEVHRKGKLSAESTIVFDREGEHWTVTSHTRGVKGLARFMNLEESSTSQGDWVDGYPRPASFQSVIKATLVNRGWSADYDWDEGVVHTVHEEGESTLELEPGVIDDSSVNLVIRPGLAQGESEWRLRVVDEDEIDHDHYRAHPPEPIETTLGCMEAVKVEKVRSPDSKRYTHTWFARDHGWVPVRLVHGKTGDLHVESHLKSLTVAGKPVTGGPACTSSD